METIDIGYGHMALGFLLLIIPAYFLYRYRTGLVKDTLWAALRMTVQLFLIGFYVVTLFIPGLMAFDRIVSMVAIAIFLAYTAYDTQRIKAFYNYYAGYPDMLAKASIFSALQLYLDFLNLFIRLLSILGRRRS